MQQEQQLGPLRQQLVQLLEPMRQQLVLEQRLVLELPLALLLFYRKQQERKQLRWRPEREICSFFDTLKYIRKKFLKGKPR